MLKIDHDLHCHTYLSACCSDESQIPKTLLALAEEMGLHTVGFCDHLWANPDLEPSPWYRPQDEGQVARLREQLAEVASSVRVLVGCEAETVAPGKFGITPAFAAGLDFVLLACSHNHMRDLVEQPKTDKPRDIADHLIGLFRSAVASGLATAIPHPFLPLGFRSLYDETIAAIPDSAFLDAFGLAAEHGVGIEITLASFPPEPTEAMPAPPVWSLETPIRCLSLAKQAGCQFILGSDAHAPDRVRSLSKLDLFAGALDLHEQDILPLARHALPLPKA